MLLKFETIFLIFYICFIIYVILDYKRYRREPNYLVDFAVTTTTAAEFENVENTAECYWRNHIYFEILDTVINNFKKRFSEENMQMASAVDNFFSLDFEGSQHFINYYKVTLQ